jgi:two-component system, cell cycle sensor histidine kinase and response regulator CckA
VKRVLVIEDNPIEIQLLLGFFNRFGASEFEIEIVNRLGDGIRVLDCTSVDVVLLDLVLEDATGLESLLRVRETSPDVAIVVLTGIDDEAQAIEALKNGAQDYLIKANVTRHVLFRAIRYAIERKNAELERRFLEQRLLEGQKLEAVGTLARGVAHNFNNMLTAILGRSALILEKPENGDTHHVVAIKKSAERAALLTRQLLTFSRKPNNELQPISLDNAIRNMKLLLESTVANEVNLEFNLAAEDASIKGDRQQIGQLLMNLVINARAAMPKGGLCTIETTTSEDDVLLTVQDTGCGMSAETLSHIFEPFFSTRCMSTAAGLGLSVVYGIVQQHHGTIEVASKPDEGTTFLIRFPLLKT